MTLKDRHETVEISLICFGVMYVELTDNISWHGVLPLVAAPECVPIKHEQCAYFYLVQTPCGPITPLVPLAVTATALAKTRSTAPPSPDAASR